MSLLCFLVLTDMSSLLVSVFAGGWRYPQANVEKCLCQRDAGQLPSCKTEIPQPLARPIFPEAFFNQKIPGQHVRVN